MRKFSKLYESTKEEDKLLIEDIFATLGDSEYIDGILINDTPLITGLAGIGQGHLYRFDVKVFFTQHCISNRREKTKALGSDAGFCFTMEEINDYWKELMDIMNTLDNHGFVSAITYYQTNSASLSITISKKGNNI